MAFSLAAAEIFLSFFRLSKPANFVSMIGDSVRLEEVLKVMETGDPFSVRFVTCDVNRGTGGTILEWDNCRLSKQLHERRGTMPAGAPAAEPAGLMPAHYRNGTRNLVVGKSTQVRKIHIWLILAFKGQKVVL